MSIEKKKFEPGIYEISNEEYHASEGISRSGISEFKKSPLHYWDKYLNPDRESNDGKASSSMTLGNIVHKLVLEPKTFDKEFLIIPKVNLNTKEGRRLKKEAEEKKEGRQIIREEILEVAKSISEEILKHPHLINLLNNAHIEKSIYWTDEDTGLLCKSRPDIWNVINDRGLVFDLKTTSDSSYEEFKRSIWKYDYHIQLAMVREGLKFHGHEINFFGFVVSSTERPYRPYIYMIDDGVLDQGYREFKEALKYMRICYEHGWWSSDRDEPIRISFSEYQQTFNPFHKLAEIYNV